MMTKITVLDASGKNTLVRPSITPTPNPVTIDPMIEPMPPITTTAKTTMMRLLPMSGVIWITGLALGLVEGLTKVFYPEASNIVVFVIMAIVLMIRPAGLFGKEK